jgi:hypothetical protein
MGMERLHPTRVSSFFFWRTISWKMDMGQRPIDCPPMPTVAPSKTYRRTASAAVKILLLLFSSSSKVFFLTENEYLVNRGSQNPGIFLGNLDNL